MLGLILASAVALASPAPAAELAADALANQAYVGVHVTLPRVAKIGLDYNLRAGGNAAHERRRAWERRLRLRS